MWRQVGVVRQGVNGIDGLANPYDVVLSTDGLFAYAAAYGSNAVTVFSRDPVTGALSQQQVITNGAMGVSGLGGAHGLRLSPDGEFLYVAGTTDNAIAIFDRNPANGSLAFVSQHTDAGSLNGLQGVLELNLSNDGNFVYAISEAQNALSVFERNSTTGTLSFVETLKDGVPPISTLNKTRSFTISSDDRFLYAPARDDHVINQFSRDVVTGQLTLTRTIANPSNFNGPVEIAFSPDGLHAYVNSQHNESLSVFNVDSLSGFLQHKTTYFNFQGDFNQYEGPNDLVVTNDGQFVLSVATIDNALNVLLRDPVTGEITVHQKLVDGVGGIDGLYRARMVELSPDQKFLYVTGTDDHAIAIFTVPEPATFVLAGMGAILLGSIACRTRMQRGGASCS